MKRATTPKELFEKSDSVLWTFMPNGIFLHNFRTSKKLELVGEEFMIWSLIDGVHSLDEVQTSVQNDLLKNSGARRTSRLGLAGTVRSVFSKLAAGGFIVRRET